MNSEVEPFKKSGDKLITRIKRSLGSSVVALSNIQKQAESRLSEELERDANRIVVFGSRISGAASLASQFKDFLEERGIFNPVVNNVRDASSITDAFYGRNPDEEIQGPDKLPRGVVMFPQMRQYTPYGTGMFVETPEDLIRRLCEENGVPVVSCSTEATPQQLTSAFGELLAETD